MKFYFEFKGKKLKNTECFSYQEGQFILFKIVDQCLDTYRRNYNNQIFGDEELRIQEKILSQLKLRIRD
jgi:hypothetical protein